MAINLELCDTTPSGCQMLARVLQMPGCHVHTVNVTQQKIGTDGSIALVQARGPKSRDPSQPSQPSQPESQTLALTGTDGSTATRAGGAREPLHLAAAAAALVHRRPRRRGVPQPAER
eukprot:3261702-Prymnesium_polylepis.1